MGTLSSDLKAHGHGVMVHADGRLLRGEWTNGTLAHGSITYPTTSIYKGMLNDGRPHGTGTYTTVQPDKLRLTLKFTQACNLFNVGENLYRLRISLTLKNMPDIDQQPKVYYSNAFEIQERHPATNNVKKSDAVIGSVDRMIRKYEYYGPGQTCLLCGHTHHEPSCPFNTYTKI